MYRTCKKQSGFTLVELLVVVTIIALLLSILLPALGKAKHAANSVVCQTQLRGIGGMYKLYATDYDDGICPLIDANIYGISVHWSKLLTDYGLDDLMGKYPGHNEDGSGNRVWCPVYQPYYGSYSQNVYLGYHDWWINQGAGDPPINDVSTFTSLRSQGTMILMSEGGTLDFCLGLVSFGEGSGSPPAPHFGVEIDPNIWIDGQQNLLYCDNHVGTATPEGAEIRYGNIVPDNHPEYDIDDDRDDS